MQRKSEQTIEATSILSPPQRAMVVWLLSMISLLLCAALLALPVLFTLEILSETRYVVRDAFSATAQLSPLPAGQDQSHGMRLSRGPSSSARATPAGLPGSRSVLGKTRSQVIVSRDTPKAITQSDLRAPWVLGSASPPATETLVTTPRATAVVPVPPTMVQPTKVPTQPSAPDPELRPVQIRIPAIKVKRSIVELPQIRDPKTGSWTQDLGVLFRKGRKDRVGHYEGSAQPGQVGNTILAGHNYGYGTKGVFLKLRRLKPGNKIEVVNAAGQTLTYRVKSVQKVPWRSKDAFELVQHAKLLAVSGSERLTLVTCGESNIQPFPARIYVVAEPVGD